MADYPVGYCYLNVDDVRVYNLSYGVDDAGDPVIVPSRATGAIITCEIDPLAELRVAANGSSPHIASKRGDAVYQNQQVIYIGNTENYNGLQAELSAFKVVISTGFEAKLHVTFIERR